MPKYTSQWAWEGMNDSEFVRWMMKFLEWNEEPEALIQRVELLGNHIDFCIFNDEHNAVIFSAPDQEVK
jgi:hypothetical protein